ncbi:MAG: shikimate kinase [Chitinophagaceae bacterium]
MKIFLLGFMGAGKSHWGKLLAAELHLPFLDLDEEIVKFCGKSVADIFEENGETYFRETEREFLIKISEGPGFILSCGGGTPCFFDNMEFMKRTGTTVWLNPSTEVMVGRIQKKMFKRPLIAHLSKLELLDFVERKLLERVPFYQQADIVVDTGNLTLTEFTQKLLHA